uniref:Uncharacterized protein n=1 Tax=Chromera velia CCMP2878 TaxID=1169474 RepID=A0A0G4G4K6_9ALVE|eukprot:Cvel_20224.t1-p1 / transcript=Cvel_20224.t1 / gene=Cvel_20224 / organism=Chromera_velia_CCMP2878 / gene_product=hypothetical protein / transcript_product=hypothetical protein / location=Cvel_scaffold1801:1466-4393(+) / protein_length=567 / sequence_SO=supercontig / SO=protein_coding / is_pseudo=false
MCRALIRAGADVRALNERGQTFLHQVFLPDDPLTGANAEQQMRDTNEGHSNGPSLPMSFPETSAGGETFNDRGETEPEISSVRAARGEQQGEAEAREEDKGTPPSFIFSFSQLELQELVGRLLLSEGVDHRSRDESGRTAADYAETSGNPLGKFLRALDGVKQREAVQQKLCSNRGAGASAGPPRPPTGSASTLGGLGASDALEGGKGSAEAAAGGGGVPPPPAGGLSRQGSWGVSSVASPFLLFSSPYSSGAGGGRQTGIGIGGPRMTPPPFSSGSMSPLCMGECLLGGKECGSGRGRSGSLSHQSTVPPCSSCLGPAAAGASSSVSASFGEVTTTCRQGIGSVRSGVAVAVGPSGRLLTGQSGGLGAAGSDDGASPTFFPFHVPPPCTPLPPRPSGGQWGLSQRGCCHGGLSGVHGSLHTGGSGSGSPLASPPYHLTPPAAGTRPPPSTPLVWGGPRVPGRECDGGNAGALSGRNSSNGGLHGTPVPPPLTRLPLPLPLPPLQLPSPLLAHPLSASRNSRNRPHAVNSRERASSSSSGNPFQLASSSSEAAEADKGADRGSEGKR